MGKLDGKVALVTGSSRGIGKAIAMKFASEGADVILNGFGGQKELKGAEKSVKQYGGGVISFLGDVSNEEFVKKMVDSAVKQFGRLDILVNNAGIYIRHDIESISLDEWEKTIHTNLRSVFLCSKYALHHLKKTSGKIINMGSMAGVIGGGSIHYATSKGGVITFTKSMAKEVGKYKVRVNSISPGPVETDMIKPWTKEKIRETEKRIPLGKLAKPEDIANTALFLASEDSSHITGANIEVCGGL